jgi:hypothetical protein
VPWDVPEEPGPPIELLPAEPLECGDELLPDVPPGPQSVIAVLPFFIWSPLMPLLEPGLLVPALGLLVPLLAPGLFEAELLPGGQSLLDRLREVPGVPALVPDLLPAPVLLLSAIAAVARVSATIEAAVRRRRCIRCAPCDKGRSRQPEAAAGMRGC